MSEDEFAITVTRQAVARACIAFGLTKSSQPVIDSLSDIVKSYIEALAVNALERAEAGGRTIVGLQDIIPAVEQTVIFYCLNGVFPNYVHISIKYIIRDLGTATGKNSEISHLMT
jgi:histone H3/H4